MSEVVEESLDLTVVYASYSNATGAPPFDPRMMLKLMLYGYSIGVTSSREIERRCATDVAFRWLSANTAPDYRSVSRFRRRHLVALDDLFSQVLGLCAAAGLVKLGRVALDGTKLRASASRHKAMSYHRMEARITDIEAQVAAMLAEAEAIDVAEDEEFGVDRRGDYLLCGRYRALDVSGASLDWSRCRGIMDTAGDDKVEPPLALGQMGYPYNCNHNRPDLLRPLSYRQVLTVPPLLPPNRVSK